MFCYALTWIVNHFLDWTGGQAITRLFQEEKGLRFQSNKADQIEHSVGFRYLKKFNSCSYKDFNCSSIRFLQTGKNFS